MTLFIGLSQGCENASLSVGKREYEQFWTPKSLTRRFKVQKRHQAAQVQLRTAKAGKTFVEKLFEYRGALQAFFSVGAYGPRSTRLT
jgi:hypothetical protein